ncbi:extracellular solute-binding protein [Streptomyces aidingensis]|uniref:Raffinose/stachyose/melibiose transport system substrate-binding protein n=1 Tax=Streptomyces aidingensis TaxID=910347 RepID=A0A1I1SI46_9ACTN|nr:extracellular solute-binding protein [Streptomyces aidingensis]SFD46144.1 raffinose/stachyose/melibiose transport system substrate-binding protein [Streptomyces aidingensis]
MSSARRGLQGAAALAAATALLLTGCGGGGDGDDGDDGTVTLQWWHIGTTEPNHTLYSDWAREFEAENPGVRIEITELENDAFKTKMATQTAAGDLPDVFSTWGGGALQQQVDAGLVRELTEDAAATIESFTEAAIAPYTLDGEVYGLPIDAGMVGFWYNQAHFTEAGIDRPPATWSEFLDAVRDLKEAGITPIALGGQSRWPGHYYWAYLAMRTGGLQMLDEAAESNDFTADGFVRAGEMLRELADMEPFQPGFMGAEYDTPEGQAALVGSGEAAMELMGQWAPAVQADTGGGIGEDLGFFRFPVVEGGAGDIDEVLGGGNGFAVAADAPDEALEFVRYLAAEPQQAEYVRAGAGLPARADAIGLIEDETLREVAEALAGASGFQLYLDQAYPPAVGQQINESVAGILAGSTSPREAVEAITAAARTEG